MKGSQKSLGGYAFASFLLVLPRPRSTPAHRAPITQSHPPTPAVSHPDYMRPLGYSLGFHLDFRPGGAVGLPLPRLGFGQLFFLVSARKCGQPPVTNRVAVPFSSGWELDN